MGSEIVQRLRKYRPTDDWGQPCQHTICDEAADHIEALETAAKAVIAQWDTPNWKLTEPTAKLIEALRAVVSSQPSGGHNANQ
ncbi:hypothetical protein [Rhizobium phage RHEph18]|uniref:hypothetical protein n=1 Tax=Rhizobium TaxID=379 RepID=UPI0007F12B18|nr:MULTISPECIES: hypothetical protein [Rhizobium]ANL02638.1 hypothetical protein AMJ99_CH01051 [Rhizobium esperanzae]ANM33490.1 hypothetical protein AMK04_CH01052 [Rhizobium sp. N871]QIG73721.1 hypothetical protein EVC05_029 [Rhizobium phage RHph_N2]QXV74439.1 hypothetical protein [Rhizobium phage RHEph18]